MLQFSLDDLLSKKKKRRAAKPKNLKEEDPILKGVEEGGDAIDMAILLEPEPEEKKTKNSVLPEKEYKTDDGKLSIKTHGRRRPKKRTGTFRCSSDGCEVVETTRAAINKHEKETHPDITYSCELCPASNFSSYKSSFKHQQRHFKFLHVCQECPKSFQYPNQLKKHKATHDHMKGVPCTWRGCKKVLSSDDALSQHVQRHRDQKLICDLCPREHDVEPDTFPTIMSLKQHKQGLHSKGYTTYCGKLCKWPSERQKHQKECRMCRDIKQQRDNKEENPCKPKARPRRKEQKAAAKNEDNTKENRDQNDESKSDDSENKDT